MTQKPRLLVLSHSPGLSGAERSLLETLHLLAQFYELHLVIPSAKGKLIQCVTSTNAPVLASVHRIPFYFDYAHADVAPWRKILWRARNWIAHRRIVSIARVIKVNAVYSNSVASWQGVKCARVLRLPHVWHLRELPLASSIGYPLCGDTAQARYLTMSNTVFLANSRFVADWYRSEFGIIPTVAYQPVVAPMARAARQDADLRILSVGRLHFEKRHHIAIKAVSLLPRDLRDRVRLEIYGDGPEREALQALINDENLSHNVFLMGYSETLLHQVAQANMVLATSVGEPFGRVTAEALLIGCPIVGIDSGGTTELLGNGNTRGILVPLDDPPALAVAIELVVSDPETATYRVDEGMTWARRLLNSEQYIATVRAAFDDAFGMKTGLS